MGVFPFLSQLDNEGLGVIIVVGGTLGMRPLRAWFLEPGQWIPAQRVAVALTGSLAVASSAAGSMPLVLICLIVTGIHVALPKLFHD